jgi:hypothetical protein
MSLSLSISADRGDDKKDRPSSSSASTSASSKIVLPPLLPTLEYGYRTTRATWSELQHIVASGELARLSRSREQQLEYEIYKRDLLLTWRSMIDFVLCDKFQYSQCYDTETERRTAERPQDGMDANSLREKVVVVRNDFPYYMQVNVEHWIL